MDTDLRNTKKNGVLYLEDPMEKEWRPHFFVLSGNKLYYTDLCKTDIDNDDEAEGGELETLDVSCTSRLREVSYTYNYIFTWLVNAYTTYIRVHELIIMNRLSHM